MNTTAQKNELIFGYSSGNLGDAKSLFVSMYLYLNSLAQKKASIFENLLADEFDKLEGLKPDKLSYLDCINNIDFKENSKNSSSDKNPLKSIIGDFDKLNWKTVYKGFKEYIVPIIDKDEVKLIKMDPGTSVPLHSHNGKEYILVLDGSFCDEYGEYKKGEMQINDQRIKHIPTACKKHGCICLSITENDLVFFGKYGSLLNLFTFVKSFFK